MRRSLVGQRNNSGRRNNSVEHKSRQQEAPSNARFKSARHNSGAKHNVTNALTATTTNTHDTLPPGNVATADLQVLPACTTTVTGPSDRTAHHDR